MKNLRSLAILAVLIGSLSSPTVLRAADAKPEKPKPYILKKCMVSDEEIDDKGDMKPYVFIHEGREIKLCCEGCLKDFKKNPAKYIKKIEKAEAKQKKKES